MAEPTLELLLAMIQRVPGGNGRIEVKQDRIVDDVSDLKFRTTNIGESLAGVNRRLDRLEMPVERMERRLELTDMSATLCETRSDLIPGRQGIRTSDWIIENAPGHGCERRNFRAAENPICKVRQPPSTTARATASLKA
jgi:hypothetical protein